MELALDRQTLEQAVAGLTLYPPVLLNVRVAKGVDCTADTRVRDAVKAAETALGGEGRVLLRPSGTEPLLRVMVEGKENGLVRQWAETIAQTVEDATRQAA